MAVTLAEAPSKRPKIVKVSWEWPGETFEAWVAESQVDGLYVTGSENIEVLDR